MNNPGMRHKARGITMVESLVALVVLSVGMLGIAGLYISSLKAGRSALVRTQAVNLATDIADRIRANRDGRESYDTSLYGGAPAIQGCLAANCTPATLAQDDLARWLVTLRAVMPGNAVGTVTFQDLPGPLDQYTVQVSWLESGDTAPSTSRVVMEL
jgi:type IV pilus assembly protein PilV